MKNNKISKITMVASLLVVGIVNAQEFYTCVPKKDWLKNTIKESVKEQKKEEWKLIDSVDVIKKKNWYEDLLKVPIGNIKIRLLKGTELIGEHILKNGFISYIKSWDVNCDCGKTNKCTLNTTQASVFDFDNEIVINWKFSKERHNDILKYSCKGIGSGSVNYFFIESSNKVLFGAMNWSEVNIFDEYFKGTTIEVWKKVED